MNLKMFIKDINSTKTIALDIETTGLDPYQDEILLIALYVNNSPYILVDEPEQEKKYILDLAFNHVSAPLLGHNLKFDLKFLFHRYKIYPKNPYSTDIVECLLNSGVGETYYHLKHLTEKYCNVTLDKELRKAFIGMSKENLDLEHIDYAIKDVMYLEEIYNKQQEEIDKLGIRKVVELENRLIIPVMLMELIGIKIDVEKWKKSINELKQKVPVLISEIKEMIISELEEKLKDKTLYEIANLLAIPIKRKSDVVPLQYLIGLDYSKDWVLSNLNIDSPKQMLSVLHLVGVDVPNTNEDTLRDYLYHPLVEKILEYRNLMKLISTYGENILAKVHPVTGALHPEFNQVGTVSGRFSSSNPNCQNIPASDTFRSNFIARDGYKLITADYSQQEYRLAGALAHDPKIIDAYKRNYDIHTATASILFDVPLEQVKKEQRAEGKTINFLTLYGGSGNKLHKTLGIPLEKANQIVEQLNSSYESLAAFRQKFGEKVYEKGFSVTAFGRKRFFKKNLLHNSTQEYNQERSRIQRQGFNTLIQGTGADIVKIAIADCFYNNPFGLENFRILLQVHDEIVFEVKEEYVEQAMEFVKKTMESAEQPFLGEIPAVVEVSVDNYWKK